MSLTFGTPVAAPVAGTAPAPTLFGTAPAASVAPVFPAFGAAAPTATTSVAAATALPTFGGFGTQTTTPSVGLAFPSSIAATTTTAPTAATPAATLATPATTAVVAAAAPSPKIGLGGVNPETSRVGAATPGGTVGVVGVEVAKTTEQQSLKEQEIPASLKVEVAAFKDHVKRVKTVREDIARFSAKPFHKVLEDVNAMSKLLGELGNNLHKNVTTVEKLRFDTHRELKNAEIAVRTRDTPQGLQYENVAPMGYFQYMVDDFEARMQTYRQQIEQLESYLAASTAVQAAPLSPQTLAALIQQIQDSFMEIAGQLQVVHEKVQTQKEHYLNYRKFILDDDSDIFASGTSKATKASARAGRTSLASVGPPPFGSTFAQKSTMASIFAALQATQTPASAQTQVPGAAPAAGGSLPFPAPSGLNANAPPTLSLGATKPPDPWAKPTAPTFGSVGFGAVGGASTLTQPSTTGFGLPALSQTSFNSAGTLFGASPNQTGLFGAASAPLTLAKPPAGNKRGKR